MRNARICNKYANFKQTKIHVIEKAYLLKTYCPSHKVFSHIDHNRQLLDPNFCRELFEYAVLLIASIYGRSVSIIPAIFCTNNCA